MYEYIISDRTKSNLVSPDSSIKFMITHVYIILILNTAIQSEGFCHTLTSTQCLGSLSGTPDFSQ